MTAAGTQATTAWCPQKLMKQQYFWIFHFLGCVCKYVQEYTTEKYNQSKDNKSLSAEKLFSRVYTYRWKESAYISCW